MSHIPASAMPHARAPDDDPDGRSTQPDQAQPAPDPATAVPPASASGGSSAGDTSAANDTAASNVTPERMGGTGGDRRAAKVPVNGPGARDEVDDRSPLVIAAMVIGGLAVVGGGVAALVPLLAREEKPKSRKRKKRKAA